MGYTSYHENLEAAQNEVEGAIRATTILNESGDTTILWTEDRDEEMAAIIQKKMNEGVTFFIITPRAFGLLPPKKTAIKNSDEAMAHRVLAIPDEDFAKFVDSGAGQAVKTPQEKVNNTEMSTDANKVAKSQSVGVKQLKGG